MNDQQTNPQSKMRAALSALSMPSKSIECYGRQIVVTVMARSSATKWAAVLGKFAKVRGITESLDYNVTNAGTNLVPTTHRVFRVFAQTGAK